MVSADLATFPIEFDSAHALLVEIGAARGGLAPAHALSSRITYIGRALDNDIVLESASISRRHARIERSGIGYIVVDLDSTNGSFLNDQHEALSICPVRSGDVLRVGETLLRFIANDAADDPELCD